MRSFPGHLDARQKTQARQIAAAVKPLMVRANKGVDDALAHAKTALTDALRDQPDGRQTITHARRSRSYVAAGNRLDEMEADLVAMVQDFRERTYRDRFVWWQGCTPVDCLRSIGAEPTLENIARCRAAILHQDPPAKPWKVLVDRQQRLLLTALTQAGGQAVRKAQGADVLSNWARTTRKALASLIQTAVNDSWVMADKQAGRDVVKPKMLPEAAS